jgi:hypothetical protein
MKQITAAARPSFLVKYPNVILFGATGPTGTSVLHQLASRYVILAHMDEWMDAVCASYYLNMMVLLGW